VKGLGWKEASHFLRNIGHLNLAILDRHILRNLKRHDVLRTLPRTLTPKRYLTIEGQFARFADTIGITMDELDLLFWSHETGEILK
jgi:N-glycosylase/DNA lyase